MFSNKKNTHRKEGASAAHDLTDTEITGSGSVTASSNKKKLPAWVIFPVLAVVIFLAWILSLFAGGKTEDSVGTPLNVVKAEKGTVKEVYNSTGTIESENTKTYYSPVTAPIKECRAVVGQAVKAGDLLVTFDTTNRRGIINRLSSHSSPASTTPSPQGLRTPNPLTRQMRRPLRLLHRQTRLRTR